MIELNNLGGVTDGLLFNQDLLKCRLTKCNTGNFYKNS